MMSERPSTLQDCCFRTIARNVNAANVLELMQVLEQLSIPQGTGMQTLCLRYVEHSYSLLRERRPMEELRQALPPQLLVRLEIEVEERKKLAAMRKAMLGHIVEPAAADPKASCHPCVPSVSGADHSYSYAALVTGLRWPEDVDPANREQYLSHEEFEQVVGMPYAAYCSLPVWKRSRLKQELQLF